ncbi:MAG: transporter, partial [Pedosphaera sp.]|nr:transporter [Pedosphaera sp.]
MNRHIWKHVAAIVSSRAWQVVGLLWLVAVLNYLDRLMITTMRDPIKAAIPMTDAQFGLLTSMFLWVYGALSPLGGFLADKFSRSKVIVGSLFVWSMVMWLTGHVKTFEQLLLARALMGISEACYIPAALALIADFHRGQTRSLATGLHMSGVYMGAALGGVGGYLAEHFGWRAG